MSDDKLVPIVKRTVSCRASMDEAAEALRAELARSQPSVDRFLVASGFWQTVRIVGPDDCLAVGPDDIARPDLRLLPGRVWHFASHERPDEETRARLFAWMPTARPGDVFSFGRWADTHVVALAAAETTENHHA